MPKDPKNAIQQPDPPFPTDPNLTRLEYDRELRNVVELLCGYIVGKALTSVIVLTAIVSQFIRVTGVPSLGVQATKDLWPLAAKTAGYTVAAVAFLRLVLPVLARSMYRGKQRHASSRWLWTMPIAVVCVLVAGASATAGRGAFAAAAMVLSLFLGGFAGALLWGGSRYYQGTDRFCTKCGYQQEQSAPGPLCPECGSDWRRPWRTRMGRRAPKRILVILGFVALAATFLLIGVAAWAARRM